MQQYLETVERFYLVLRRQGLMLSPRDVALIEEWAGAGVPLEVVCRGLLQGASSYWETHGESSKLPAGLHYFKEAVEAELGERESHRIMLHDVGGAGSGNAESQYTLPTDVLAGAFESSQSLRLQPCHWNAYDAAWQILSQHDPATVADAFEDADRAAVCSVFDSLSDADKARIEAEVERRLDGEREMLGTRGLVSRKEAILEDIVIEEFSLARLAQFGEE